MRLSYRPALPPEPPSYRPQVFDHLGLVAGMVEDLGLTAVLDQATQQAPEMRMVTVGHAVKAMVLHGLGFVNQRLSLVPHFFHHKPRPRLIAPGSEASHRHDDSLGRALETLYEPGLTALDSLIAATAATRLGLTSTCTPLDTTRGHGDGRYNSAEAPDDPGGHLTPGSRRAHRPDLNQVMRELLVEHPAGIPVLMPPLSGHSSDAHECGQVIQAHMAHLHTTSGSTYLGADSALESAAHLQKRAEPPMKWITRVPATLGEAHAVLAHADPQTMASLREGYRCRVGPSTYGGVAHRWVLLDAEQRQPPAQRTVDRQWRQQSDPEGRAFQRLCRAACACEADAQQALTRLAAGWQPTVLHARTVCPTPP
jgi:transposase